MNKDKRKELKAIWRRQQREVAMAALPLPPSELRAMFDMLDTELSHRTCDHSRSLTQAWLRERGHDVSRVFAWLDTQGGFCDCEVLANVEEKVDDATRVEGKDSQESGA